MLIKLINRAARPYWGWLVVIISLQLVATIASLTLPSLNAKIIDRGVALVDTDAILHFGGIMLAVSALQGICTICAVFCSARTAMAMGRDMRQWIIDKVMSFSRKEVNSFGAPSLLTRTTNDVQQVQMLVFMTCAMMVSAPIMMVGGVVMALREDLVLSWLIVVSVVVLGGFVGLLMPKLTYLFRMNQRKIDQINRIVREQISGIRVIRAFTREEHEQKRFDEANRDLMNLSLKIGTFFSMLFPFVHLVMDLSSVAVMWFGASRIESGGIEVGQLTAFLSYLMQILISVMLSTMMVMMAPRAAECAKRIGQVLNTESSVTTRPETTTPDHNEGRVFFDHVSFHYEGAHEPVLSDLNFSIEPGTTTAIIGSTGSGKTSLVNLIPRLFDATHGSVKVDGIDVRDYDPEILWQRIGFVPQKAYLFSGTIRSNLEYGRPHASDEQCWEALRIAQADDFVRALPEGLDAPVAQGGTNFSGGQRQRLSIARSIIKASPIMIFDDAFSALDVATDAALRAELAKATSDTSVIIVAQRISTIRHADQIIVLDSGRIAGIGTHDELLDTCQVYQEIVASQMNSQEVK